VNFHCIEHGESFDTSQTYQEIKEEFGFDVENIFKKPMMRPFNMAIAKKHEETMKIFFDLACALSPEDLHCDGEISQSAAQAKYRKLISQWKEQEQKINMKVSESNVWCWDATINKKKKPESGGS